MVVVSVIAINISLYFEYFLAKNIKQNKPSNDANPEETKKCGLLFPPTELPIQSRLIFCCAEFARQAALLKSLNLFVFLPLADQC